MNDEPRWLHVLDEDGFEQVPVAEVRGDAPRHEQDEQARAENAWLRDLIAHNDGDDDDDV